MIKSELIGRVNISYEIPRILIKDIIQFYHDTLGLPMYDSKEGEKEYVLCKFGTSLLWFIPTDGPIKRDIWLEIKTDNKSEALKYFLEKDVPIKNMNPRNPSDMTGFAISDPLGMLYLIQ